AAASLGQPEEMPKFPRKRAVARARGVEDLAAQNPVTPATSAPGRAGQRSGVGAVPQPIVGIGGPTAPSPTVNFEGIDRTDSPANLFIPPDTTGAAGARFYLQMVNVTFAVYDKAGAKLLGPLPQATVWAGFGGPCETTEGGDSVVLYDRYADRFLFTKLAYPTGVAIGPFYQCIAVSVTDDPRGAWNRYSFIISETKFNDYPKFGIWPDGYYYTANQYADVGTASEHIAGVAAGVFERDKMLLGLPARLVLFDTLPLGEDVFAMLPGDADGPILPPAGSPNYFVNMKNEVLDDHDTTRPLPAAQVWRFHVDWRNPSSSSFDGPNEIETMAFNPFFNGAQCSDPGAIAPELCVPQPPATGGTCTPATCVSDQKLDSIPDRLLFRLQYRHGFNSAIGEYESLVSNHTVNVGGDTNRAGIHWLQLIQTPNASWNLYQDGIYAPEDGNSRWMASIGMDESENIALGYSVSSPTLFPSIRYTGRKWDDPLGKLLQAETTLVAGAGSQGHPAGRWGDYSAMVIDPLDDCTFWYTNEYGKVTSRSNWATRAGAFHFDTCGVRNTH
ncbi:MAG: hypothetical protein M3069_32210, partial [Chloroflexota bacterium]|nr:hypothetical protein [Chloroflexota bacterium]